MADRVWLRDMTSLVSQPGADQREVLIAARLSFRASVPQSNIQDDLSFLPQLRASEDL